MLTQQVSLQVLDPQHRSQEVVLSGKREREDIEKERERWGGKEREEEERKREGQRDKPGREKDRHSVPAQLGIFFL